MSKGGIWGEETRERRQVSKNLQSMRGGLEESTRTAKTRKRRGRQRWMTKRRSRNRRGKRGGLGGGDKAVKAG